MALSPLCFVHVINMHILGSLTIINNIDLLWDVYVPINSVYLSLVQAIAPIPILKCITLVGYWAWGHYI